MDTMVRCATDNGRLFFNCKMRKLLIYILLFTALLASATNIQTLQGQFTQIREQAMFADPQESNGVFYFAADSLLRWEYTRPNSFGIIVNGDNIKMIKNDKITSANNTSALRNMVGMIMQTINPKDINDNQLFQIQATTSDDETILTLIPKKRGARSMFTNMEIRLDKDGILAKQVKMTEKSGDTTTIIFTNLKLNEPIDNSLF